ncbi:MAG TPA: EamA family transporter [Candidatus Binatia bacterium]|nr:EamA family transporter [Candidatus Binatia bacterium]
MTQLAFRSNEYRASLVAIWSALTVVYLVWGSTYLAIRFAVETAPPLLMAAARFIVSGGCLLVWRRAAGDAKPTLLEWRNAAIIGFFLLVGGNGGVVWAAQFIPSSLSALLVATVPLWMVLIDTLRPGGKRPGLKSALGILIGFCGAALLIGWSAGNAGAMNLAGAAAVVFASIMWATGSLYGRTAPLPASLLLATGMEMLIGGIAQIFIALALGEWSSFDPVAVSQRSALALIYLTVIGSCAFVAYAWLLRVAPTPLVATYAYVNPLVAVLLGYFLANEPMSARTLLAAALIIGSVVLVSGSKKIRLAALSPSSGDVRTQSI